MLDILALEFGKQKRGQKASLLNPDTCPAALIKIRVILKVEALSDLRENHVIIPSLKQHYFYINHSDYFYSEPNKIYGSDYYQN